MDEDLINSDNMTFLENYHERLDLTLRYSQLLQYNLMKLGHKTSKVRDTDDELAQGLLEFSMKEIPCATSESGDLFNWNLKQYAYCLLSIEDQRDENIECLNSKVLQDLNDFIEAVKFTKNKDYKALVDSYRKEQPRRGGIKNILNIVKKTKSQSELTAEMSLKKQQIFNEYVLTEIDNFENKKIEKLNETLKVYTQSQIDFHSKALELYTKAYECLINEEILDTPTAPNRKESISASARSESNLDLSNVDEMADSSSEYHSKSRKSSRKGSYIRDSWGRRRRSRKESMCSNSLRDLNPVDMFVSNRSFRLNKSHSLTDRHQYHGNPHSRKRSIHFHHKSDDPLDDIILDRATIISGGIRNDINHHSFYHETRI